MSKFKNIIRSVLPFGLIDWRRKKFQQQLLESAVATRADYHHQRQSRIQTIEQTLKQQASLNAADFDQVVKFLTGLGVPEQHVLEGSVPYESLVLIEKEVISKLDQTRPLKGLHVGNFVGVSLAFLTASLVKQNSESLMVSIDPNLTHRGVNNPQSYVLRLLSACGLQFNSLVLAGYSGKKSVSNDATVFEGYDPLAEFSNEAATENTLKNLHGLTGGSFDVIFLDGNHDASYLINELRDVAPLLNEEGYVVLDDVDAAWEEIRDVFAKIDSFGLKPVTANGRVGIAQKDRANSI